MTMMIRGKNKKKTRRKTRRRRNIIKRTIIIIRKISRVKIRIIVAVTLIFILTPTFQPVNIILHL